MKCKNCGNDYEGTACPTCGMANQTMGQPSYGNMNPKKPIFKKWWFWVLIAIGVITVIGIIVGAAGGGKTSSTTSTATSTSTAAASTATSSSASVVPSTKSTFGVGETATTKDGLSITMTNVTESSGAGYFKPATGDVWVMAHFKVENNSKDTVTISSLMDFTGYIDDKEATPAVTAAASSGPDSSLDVTIAPGETVTGVLAYSAPKDYKNLKITYHPNVYDVSKDNLNFTYSK